MSDPIQLDLEDYIRKLNELADDVKKEYAPVENSCECGALKVHGARKGSFEHSAWCPWSPVEKKVK